MCNLSPNLFHSETTVIKAHFFSLHLYLVNTCVMDGVNPTVYMKTGVRDCRAAVAGWGLTYFKDFSSKTVLIVAHWLYTCYWWNWRDTHRIRSNFWHCSLLSEPVTCQDPNRHLLLTRTSSHDVLPFHSIPSVTVVLLEYKSKWVGI